MPIIELKEVGKKFGGITAVDDLSFTANEHQIIGLIGPNGAGKTTVFNLITGVYKPTAGNIIFQGKNINGLPPDKIVQHGIARTFQNIRLFRNLTALQNVCIALDRKLKYSLGSALMVLPGVRAAERQVRQQALELLGIIGLEDNANTRADALPYGLQRKLEIARALALNPKLLLLDEPAAGMNPEESRQLAGLIMDIYRRFDLTILLIEHHMDVVMEVCQKIVVLNFGEKLSEGTTNEIQSDPRVLEAYLGREYKHGA